MFREQFSDVAKTPVRLREAIVNTVREPLVVLDQDLRVVAASRSFYRKFEGQLAAKPRAGMLYELGDGRMGYSEASSRSWKKFCREARSRPCIEAYEIEHDFPGIGRRTMCLNARKLFYEKGSRANILVGIEDITAQRVLEHEKDDLLRQKDVLLEELQHRVANSLQIIASIIMMKAMAVELEETRRHLKDAHQRVMSVAAVQQHLHAVARSGPVQLGPYLSKLCEALSYSMIGDNRSISLAVRGEDGSASCRDAESIGLIVTELVINSIKHAFDKDAKDGQITVAFDVSGTDWKLSVTDNGIGKSDGVFAQPKSGLGTGIVDALAKQLDAKVETVSGPRGTSVSVTHATFRGKENSSRSDRKRH